MGFLSRLRSVAVGVVAEAMVQAQVRKAGLSSSIEPAHVEPAIPRIALPEPLPVSVISDAKPVAVVDPDEFDDEIADDLPPPEPEVDRTVLLRAMGLEPFARPCYPEFGEKAAAESPTGKMTDHPYNDADFGAWLLAEASSRFLQPTLFIDVASQLPAYSVGSVSFYSVATEIGFSLSMISRTLTPLDMELAAIGWLRYVAHSAGPAIPAPSHENVESAGTMWEGYVYVGVDSANKVKSGHVAKRVAETMGRNAVLMTAKRSLEAGLPFNSANQPSAWVILFLNKPLKAKLLT